MGETVVDDPDTDAPFRVRVGVGFPETDQERVLDWPEVMDEGEGVKEEMEGAESVGTLPDEGIRETAPVVQ